MTKHVAGKSDRVKIWKDLYLAVDVGGRIKQNMHYLDPLESDRHNSLDELFQLQQRQIFLADLSCRQGSAFHCLEHELL